MGEKEKRGWNLKTVTASKTKSQVQTGIIVVEGVWGCIFLKNPEERTFEEEKALFYEADKH